MSQTSPTAVSAKLHRAGFNTVATRKLEGIRVSRSALGEVHIVVDHDMHRSAKRVADLLDTELKTWEGYTYRRNDDVHFYIKKTDKPHPTGEGISPAPAGFDPAELLDTVRAEKRQRVELAEIIADYSGLRPNDADHIAGMIIAAGFTRK